MKRLARPTDTRRRALTGWALAAPLLGPWPGGLQAQALAATPACGRDEAPTPRQTEGPFFKPRSPQRQSLLEADTAGERLLLTGQVLGTDCRPVAGALLDFWQADAGGAYDNEGFRLRGHQFADAEGRYRLETVVPALYPGRTRHLHVKVQRPSGRVLTTQLYFPDEPANQRDGIFAPALLMTLARSNGGAQAGFDFVLAVA